MSEHARADIGAWVSALEAPRLLVDKFVREFGTFICGQLPRQFFGRTYCLIDPGELEKLAEAEEQLGPKTCGHLVGNTARWVMEILLDGGAVNLKSKQ